MEQFPVTLDMYQSVVGLLLPLLISFAVSPTWPAKAKVGVSFVLVLVAATGHVFFMGAFVMEDLPGTILKILFLSTGSYLVFWRPAGIAEKVERSVGIHGKAGSKA